MMMGIGGSDALQRIIDTGAPVVKIVKPYRNIDLIYDKLQDAGQRGCVAVGMDIDHFYGALRGTRVRMADKFGPRNTDELKQLVSETKLPFIIKGVLSLTDAEKAVQLGASAIIVSNHGRGAIDFTVPSMIALPGIADAVGQKLTVFVDTGFQTGNDVLKALALGAKGVGFASAILLAYAAGGSAQVENLIRRINAELSRTMAATGCADLAGIRRSIIYEMPAYMLNDE
jgi:4-hydroxymandelate oxidase